jgi:hypothetical protein
MTIDLKSVLKLAAQPHSVPLMRAVVFDGRNAIAVGTSCDPQPWWAGVPCPQPDLKAPVAVPVDAVSKHFLRSRHLHVAADHLHNAQGMKTEWDRKVDWSDALSLLPQPPTGEPIMFDLDLDVLDRVLIAAGDADIRHVLNSVLLDLTTGRIAASDGSRLHLYERRAPKLLPKAGQGPLHVLVPKPAAKWLLYSSDKSAKVTIWQLGTDKPLVLMQTSDALVFTSSVVGKFPDYMRIVQPRSWYTRWARVHPVQLAESVKSMAKLNAIDKPKYASVAVQWAQGRIYAGAGPNFVGIDCKLEGTPGTWHAAPERIFGYFTPRYLEDAADCVTEGSEWCIPGPGDRGIHEQAVCVFEGDFLALVMPQRESVPPSDGPEPVQKPAKEAKPAQVPPSGPEPVQKPAKGAKPAQVPPSGPEPVQKPAKGAKPAQVPPSGPEPVQKPAKGAKPAQVPPSGPEPVQKPAKGAKPAQVPPSGPEPVQKPAKGAKPAQVPPSGPEPLQKPAKGPKPAQVNPAARR